MAPICTDPRQIIITLEPAQRQALLRVVHEITQCMIIQWQTPYEELGSLDPEDEEPQDQKSASDISEKGKGKQPSNAANSEQAENVQRAALIYALEWRDEFLTKLDEIVSVKDGPKVVSEREKRRDSLQEQQQQRENSREDREDGGSLGGAAEVDALRALYPPVSTSLATLCRQDREEALSCVLLLLLSTGKYSAHSRILILYLASALGLPQSFVNNEEAEIATSLMESASTSGSDRDAMSAEAEAEKRRQENKASRFWKVGLASVAGAAVIGVTGGLAAPLVAGAIGGILGGVGLGGVASFLGIFWMNGALVGTLFGAFGAKMTGGMVDKYAKEIQDFRFLPVSQARQDALLDSGPPREGRGKSRQQQQQRQRQQQQRRLRVTIGISGWLESEDDVTRPWTALGPDSEVFALRYEVDAMLAFGKALHDFIQSMAWKALKMQVIKRTLLTALWAALWPIQVLSVASNVDNPFNRASNRSQKAGRLLADALINRVQGERPVTLVGYSCGATTIHACLQSLAQRQAFGLVDTVVLLGTPAPSDAGHWRAVHPVVSGKIFNVFSENDMVLAFVYRVHSLRLGVAGLQAIKGVHGIENVDLSDRISGHLRYASLTGEILRRCGFDDVRAGDDIAKDEMIELQERHAQGQLDGVDLISFDEDLSDSPAAASAAANKAAGDLEGLTLAGAERPPSPVPPLPRRPVASPTTPTTDGGGGPSSPTTQTKTINRRPLPPRHTPSTEAAIARRPVPSQAADSSGFPSQAADPPSQAATSPDAREEGNRPQPEPNPPDHEEHAGIRMVDLDEPEEERQDTFDGRIDEADGSPREAFTRRLENRIPGYHA